ncbi:vacuolar protein sorting 16B [Lycorma delicatula]|uniref:vacuolar protein sorting 16B n=1 Tax=Lycorma delicatula TaxID=130591 RepID=UPI003F5193D9
MEDSYWFESAAQKNSFFSFDDAEENVGSSMCGVSLEGTVKLFQEMKKDTVEDDSSFQLTDNKKRIPLCNLISQKSLNKILDFESDSGPDVMNRSSIPAEEEVKILRRQMMDRWVAPDVNDTIIKILLGQPCSLELYKSLENKKSLLTAAVSMGDGDSILIVVLFLLKTLKKGLFNQLLMSNPVAVNHYVNHLATRMQVQEITDILTMLGRTKDASIKQFEMACLNPQRQLNRLNNCLQNHFTVSTSDRQYIEKFIKLLEWQKMAKIPKSDDDVDEVGLSVVDCLSYACENHWSEAQGSAYSPFVIAQQHGVSDKQFQWTVLLVRGKLKAWEDIENFFITKRWLGGRKLKASVPMEQVVLRLHSLEAPTNILISYLSLIDNIDKRLKIARSIECHKAVIDIFATQRDRISLLNYEARLIPQSEEYIYAKTVLHSPTVKWKN